VRHQQWCCLQDNQSECNSGYTSPDSEHGILCQQLAQKPEAAGAEGLAKHQLPVSAYAARQQQVRDIRAGNHQ
jgi:hypothetical protein